MRNTEKSCRKRIRAEDRTGDRVALSPLPRSKADAPSCSKDAWSQPGRRTARQSAPALPCLRLRSLRPYFSGCGRGFMEHEGASAMAAQRHDSSRLHCGAQRLQDPSAVHKKYACFRRRWERGPDGSLRSPSAAHKKYACFRRRIFCA